MIIPFLNGILHWSKIPVTWLIVFLNMAVLSYSYNPWTLRQDQIEETFKDDFFLKSQGRLYAQFIHTHSFAYSPLLQKLSKRSLQGESGSTELLGSLAFRNRKFLQEAPFEKFQGDQVAYQHWKRSLASIQALHNENPSYILGLNAEDIHLPKWVTYIFVHSGPAHLIGNMLFLLLFGAVLEPVIGGLALLVLFILSGVFAAGVFLFFSGTTLAPLVGASGAVSGVMAYLCFLYWNKPVRFIYWLFLPLKGFAGFVYLPGWVIFVLWFVADGAGYLSTVQEFGGVAYTAHLGGEFIGLFVGLLISALRGKYAGAEVPVDNIKMGTLIPFIDPFSVRKGFSLKEGRPLS